MLLRSPHTERRLLGAILAEPGVLDWCAAVEPEDFTNLHLRFAFEAMRNVQAAGIAVDFDAVADELERAGQVQVNLGMVGLAILEPDYGCELLVGIDARWLRRLANRRRNA